MHNKTRVYDYKYVIVCVCNSSFPLSIIYDQPTSISFTSHLEMSRFFFCVHLFMVKLATVYHGSNHITLVKQICLNVIISSYIR